MNVNLICMFESGEKALAWAVVEQSIIDYRSTNSNAEKQEILDFLCDYLPKDYYISIRSFLDE